MKCRIELVTPEIAQDYLKANVENRKTRSDAVSNLTEAMLSGKWKENGESIIFDSNGVLKDGQHRLMATVASKHSWQAVIVTGVKADVFDTIDTGMNRSLADVLGINNFELVSVIAPIIKASILYNRAVQLKQKKISRKKVSNGVGLKYAIKHRDVLYKYASMTNRVYKYSQKAASLTFLGLALHVICKGKAPLPEHEEFLKRLVGLNVAEGTGTAWLFSIMNKAKRDKTRLDNYWRIGILIKVYNMYVQGDPEVRYVKFDSSQAFPEIV